MANSPAPKRPAQEQFMIFAMALGVLMDLLSKNEQDPSDPQEKVLRVKVKQMHTAFGMYKKYHKWIFTKLDQVDEKCNIGTCNPLLFAIRLIDVYQHGHPKPMPLKIDTSAIIDEAITCVESSKTTYAFNKADEFVAAIKTILIQKTEKKN